MSRVVEWLARAVTSFIVHVATELERQRTEARFRFQMLAAGGNTSPILLNDELFKFLSDAATSQTIDAIRASALARFGSKRAPRRAAIGRFRKAYLTAMVGLGAEE